MLPFVPTYIYRFFLILGGVILMNDPLASQERLTHAFDYYRTWGDRNPLEWAEIRSPNIQRDSLIVQITRRMTEEKHGYIVYPAKLGNIFRFIENPDAQQALLRMGYLQLPTSSVPSLVKQCSYTPWLFGNELLTPDKDINNQEALDRFFQTANGQIKVRRALWYYFNPKDPENKWPAPTVDNLYFFKGKTGDYDRMQRLLASGKEGYIICPVWTEDITGALDSRELNPEVKGSGTVEFLITESPLSIALNFNVWEEEATDLSPTDIVPFVYEPEYLDIAQEWLLSVKELYPETIRSFYGYFDHRTEEEIQQDKADGHCITPVFQEDGLLSEADTLNERILRQKKQTYTIVPYWMEDVYQKLPESTIKKINRIEYLGCAIDPSSGKPAIVNNWQKKEGIMDLPLYQDKPFDLLVLFRGKEATTRFLQSPDNQIELIEGLFGMETGLMNREPSLRRANGLNLYFADYDFTNKREMVQFTKSVSFVIDSFCVDQKKIYGDYDLTVTFPIEAKEHIGYLSILLKYKLVDRICFMEFDELGLPIEYVPNPDNPEGAELKMVIYEDEYESPLLTNLWNSLCYLLDPFPFGDEVTTCSNDITELVRTQFAAPVLIYLIIACFFLVLLLITLVVLYFTYSKFYIFAQHQQRYIVPVLLTLVSEIILVLYLITNVVSTRETYNIWTQLFILAIPFVFFILAAKPFMYREREPLP